jgi:protein-disulfide isomerase
LQLKNDMSVVKKDTQDLRTAVQQISEQLAVLKQLLQEKSARENIPQVPLTHTALNMKDEPFLGLSSAPLAIMEYSDFECPYCQQFMKMTFPLLFTDYIEQGRVRYFHRDVTMEAHTHAVPAAAAARCANEQGKFWEMDQALFSDPKVLTQEEILGLAEGIGLDVESFKKCNDSGKYVNAINESTQEARTLGVSGTPSFVLGTVDEAGTSFKVEKVIVGAIPYDTLKSDVDNLLLKGSPIASPDSSPDPNAFTGSCLAYQTYTVNTGVRDSHGNYHKGADGITSPIYTVVKNQIRGVHKIGGKPGQACFAATATVELSVTIAQSYLTLTVQPPACDQCACSQAVQNYLSAVMAHEQQHAQVDKQVVADINFELKDYPLKACTLALLPNVNESINRAFTFEIQAVINRIEATKYSTNAAIDRNDNTQLDCSKCATCTGAQSPTCFGQCPAGQINYQGQCLSLCGPIVNNVYQNCGLAPNGNGFGVACCSVVISGVATGVCSPNKSVNCPGP